MRQTHTEVLIVGAGPVGLWSALVLAESGIEVTLIDREARTTARSYACALHPETLRLLDRFGLAESAIARGRRVDKVAFYDGTRREAELQLSKLGGEFPFLLILPQNALEGLLEQRLRAAGVSVLWHHRFESLAEEEESVAVNVEQLEGTSTGYIVPHWETVVRNRATIHSEFLIGADGHHSMVRPRLGLDYKRVGEAESFAAFEFETEEKAMDELRVVLDESTTNVLWPLGENRYRWTFQLARGDVPDFPEKERRSVRLEQASVDERIRTYVQRVAQQRAPWFTAPVTRVHWCTEVSFERGLVAQFGRNRGWLVGDAAHQTGPVGVQSMNGGFAEGNALSCHLRKVLREAAPLQLLDNFHKDWHRQWSKMLGLEGGLKPQGNKDSWTAKRADRILPCLPAFGDGLAQVAAQLDLVPR